MSQWGDAMAVARNAAHEDVVVALAEAVSGDSCHGCLGIQLDDGEVKSPLLKTLIRAYHEWDEERGA